MHQSKAHTLAQTIAAENASAESSRDSQSPQFCPFSSQVSLVLSSYFLQIFRSNGNRITDFWTLPIKTVYHGMEKGGNGSNCCLIKWNGGGLGWKISWSGILVVLLFSPHLLLPLKLLLARNKTELTTSLWWHREWPLHTRVCWVTCADPNERSLETHVRRKMSYFLKSYWTRVSSVVRRDTLQLAIVAASLTPFLTAKGLSAGSGTSISSIFSALDWKALI